MTSNTRRLPPSVLSRLAGEVGWARLRSLLDVVSSVLLGRQYLTAENVLILLVHD